MRSNVLKGILCTMLLTIMCFCGCSKDNKNDEPAITSDEQYKALSGKWSVDENTSYYFDDSGSGKLLLPDAEYDFKYEIKNNELQIDFAVDSVTDSNYEFTVDNSTLTLISQDANKGTFQLRKQ